MAVNKVDGRPLPPGYEKKKPTVRKKGQHDNEKSAQQTASRTSSHGPLETDTVDLSAAAQEILKKQSRKG